MTSVERICEYIDIKPEENISRSDSTDLEKGWPSEGKIEVKNVTMRYSQELLPALDDISFTIEPKEKVILCELQ